MCIASLVSPAASLTASPAVRRGSSNVRQGKLLACLLLFCIGLPAMLGADELPDLPEGIASFGAAVAGDDLYVFGGHVGKTHQHSVENLSHRFLRLDLAQPQNGWVALGDVQGLQGLPLVSDGRRVCRVGGLEARNDQQEAEEDLHSLAAVACFDPSSGRWQELPPLPQPRSSHDAVWMGGKIYVLGGWQLRGAGNESVWQNTMAILDMSSSDMSQSDRSPGSTAWRLVPQPFERRALAVAAAGGKIYAFGGLGRDGTSRRVDIYDPATETWSVGPELPEMADKRMKGFGVSAFGVGERVYLSGADGAVHALEAQGDWRHHVGQLQGPRFFHRLLHHGDHLLFVGGAAKSGHLADIEVLPLAKLQEAGAETNASASIAASTSTKASNWPGFRGAGDGHLRHAEMPLVWSRDDNVAWRAPLPGYGQSAPVIWQDQVFVTSVEGPEKETLILSSFDLVSGEVRWRRRFAASRHLPFSDMVSRGAPTPTVDAERLVAFWESGDLIAVDHRGETLWRRSLMDDYGDFAGNHGVASSPVLASGLAVVQVSHDGPSYFLAVDQSTGQTRWRVERPEGVAWTTPSVVTEGASQVLISSAAGRVEALDAATGERIWGLEGIEKNHVPSAVVDGNLVVVASSEPGQSLALRRGQRGELGPESIVWRAEGVTSGFASPVVSGDCVLFVNKAGSAHCLDRTSGAEHWRRRLAEASWASPVAVGERVYFFGKTGQTTVLDVSAGGSEVVAENELPGDDVVYGVAATAGAWVIRYGQEVVRIGE